MQRDACNVVTSEVASIYSTDCQHGNLHHNQNLHEVSTSVLLPEPPERKKTVTSIAKIGCFPSRLHNLKADDISIFVPVYINIVNKYIWYPPPKDLPVFVFYWYLRGFTASSRIPRKFDF